MSGRAGGEGPHFLGIGAQRAGTTWVHSMLSSNPAVWLPPMKELHFFDAPGGRRPLRRRRLLALLREPDWAGALRGGPHAPADLAAMTRYELAALTGRLDLRHYRALFRRAAAAGRVTGEITPAYSTLPPARVREVREALGPGLRAFMVLRDPVDRMWSQATKDAPRGPGGTLDLGRCAAFVAGEACRARTRYAQALETWGAVLGEENVLAVHFDEIAERPAELMRRLEAFLGVPREIPAEILPAMNSYQAGRAGAEADWPEPLRRALAEFGAEECRRLLALRPSPYAERWLARAEAMLAPARGARA